MPGVNRFNASINIFWGEKIKEQYKSRFSQQKSEKNF
jgi:hypothetical protein